MENPKSISPGLPSSRKRVYFSSLRTPLGVLHAAATEKGLLEISVGKRTERAFVHEMEHRYGIRPVRRDSAFKKFREELKEYFAGRRGSFKTPIALWKGSPFERSVWKALARIPHGQTRSYAWVARRIRRPKAFRAVGRACGENPLPILIPCHRVIAESGRLGGYTGGISIKRWLLDLEGFSIRSERKLRE